MRTPYVFQDMFSISAVDEGLNAAAALVDNDHRS